MTNADRLQDALNRQAIELSKRHTARPEISRRSESSALIVAYVFAGCAVASALAILFLYFELGR